MYLCVRGIDIASFFDFPIYCSYNLVFFFVILLLQLIRKKQVYMYIVYTLNKTEI